MSQSPESITQEAHLSTRHQYTSRMAGMPPRGCKKRNKKQCLLQKFETSRPSLSSRIYSIFPSGGFRWTLWSPRNEPISQVPYRLGFYLPTGVATSCYPGHGSAIIVVFIYGVHNSASVLSLDHPVFSFLWSKQSSIAHRSLPSPERS